MPQTGNYVYRYQYMASKYIIDSSELKLLICLPEHKSTIRFTIVIRCMAVYEAVWNEWARTWAHTPLSDKNGDGVADRRTKIMESTQTFNKTINHIKSTRQKKNVFFVSFSSNNNSTSHNIIDSSFCLFAICFRSFVRLGLVYLFHHISFDFINM